MVLALMKSGLVAPYAGAWIEIPRRSCSKSSQAVAPYAGAWIEILSFRETKPLTYWSHPTRVRGLKC